jgi:hypothetical protein
VPLAVAALLAGVALPAGAAAAPPVVVAAPGPATAVTSTPWTLAPIAPRGRFPQNTLDGVAAVAPNDVWAVGASWSSQGDSAAQAFHFNGAEWTGVPTPSFTASWLSDVDATSATNVWAVGGAYAGDKGRPLVTRLINGAWVAIPTPAPGPAWHSLNSVDMVTARYGWAVGSYAPVSGGGDRSNLALRWNGFSWQSVPVPNLGAGVNVLTSISVDGPNTAWAVGHFTPAVVPRQSQTVILRWNGSVWARVPSPSPAPTGTNELRSVTAISPTEAWAVGQVAASGWASRRPLALRWDGHAWSEVPLNPPDERAWEFTAVAALSSTEVYFVGYRNGGATQWDFHHDNDFVRRWDGTRFVPETVDLPPQNPADPGSRGIVSALSAVAVLPSGHLWAVGHLQTNDNHVLQRRPAVLS